MVTTHPQFSWTNLTMEISENVWNLFKAKNKDTKTLTPKLNDGFEE